MKYIEAEKLIRAIEDKGLNCSFAIKMERLDTLALIDELQQEQPEVDLEKAARNVYESMNNVRRDMVELGRVINARNNPAKAYQRKKRRRI